jgi:hypothetical protein
MTEGRIVIIPFLHGKLAPDGTLIEPDIDGILKKWLERHPQFRGRQFHVINTGGNEDCLVRVTADFSPDLAAYNPAEDADLYYEFLAKSEGSPPRFQNIWIEQCEAAKQIETEFGTQKALDYLVGEKFLNFLEAAETDASFRSEIPEFVAGIKGIFERWQLAQYVETALQTEPFDPALFEDDEETEPEEVEDMRKDDIRRCTRNLLLMERAREWLLEE